jgi:O-antigen/teichoic acid export membrane protein
LFFIFTTSKAILQAVLSFIWLKQGWGITSIFASGAIASILMAIVLIWIQLRDTGLQFSLSIISNITKYAYPILISGLASFLLIGFDRWILVAHIGEDAIAPYAVAIKFAMIPVLLIQPFTLWWYPKRFSVLANENGKEENARFAIYGSILAVVACGLLGVIGPFVIQLTTPEPYHEAMVLLPWLVLATMFKMISELLNLGCYTETNSQLQMRIHTFSCVIGTIGFFILIPMHGIYGAIISILFGNVIRMFLFYYFSQKILFLPYRFKALYTASISTFFLLVIGQWSIKWMV